MLFDSPKKATTVVFIVLIFRGEYRTTIGGFASGGIDGDFYWSSSEFSSSEAWDQEFNVGFQGYGIKSYPTYVRVIRSF